MTRLAVLALLLLTALVPSARAAETVLTLTPRPGATLRVLVDRPTAPIGGVLLMAGNDGVLDIDASGTIGSTSLRENHLVRTRASYVKAGYAVFVPDVASDLKRTPRFRFGPVYGQDVAAIVAAARQVARPVAIIGTSKGALSVMAVFAKQSAVLPDAAVISSGALMGSDNAQGIGDPSSVRVPVLLLRHRQDFCRITPPADADRFRALLTGAPKVDIVTLDGGGPANNFADACGAWHYHGFYGIDDRAVAATVQWLGANMRR
jgi:dienelactone hydrolase